MKKIILIACCFLLVASAGLAQKYAIIDTRYILDKMPDYSQGAKAIGWGRC